MTQDQDSHGSFPTGLVVGFLVGATGYFVTQTQEGRKMKDEFMEHWQDIKEDLIAQGIISEAESEITDYIGALRNKVTEFLGEHAQNSDDAESKLKNNTKKSGKKTRKKKLFKGI
jgi:gas vesicle protein